MADEQARETQAMPPLSLSAYKILLPSVFGLAFSAAVVNLAIQQAHRTTGVSTYDGWSVLAACVVMGGLFASTFLIKRFSKRAISLMVFLSIHLAGLAALLNVFLAAAGLPVAPIAELLLQASMTVGATLLEFYWMRKLRGTSAQAVTVVVFCALAVSEVITFGLSFLPDLVCHVAVTALMFSQFFTVRVSRAMGVPSDSFPAVSESYFGTDENHFSNRSFLAVAAMGIWFISVPMGMGRGFPSGGAIYMDPWPRALVLLLVLAVSALWIRSGLSSRMRALTTSIWVIMELLLGVAAILFAVWPVNASMGGAFVLTAALVLQAFVWYMTIAFISFGWRDPFYYASAAWIAMNLLTVAGMHVDDLVTRIMPANMPVIISIMSFFVLVSAQVVFTRLLASPTEAGEAAARAAAARAAQAMQAGGAGVGAATAGAAASARGGGLAGGSAVAGQHVVTQADVRRIPLMGVLAISPQNELPMPSVTPDVHIATSVMEMGQRFGLTGREVEVLTLYALGHTQARVSEELQLSTNTVHTHIKRIYEKTDLHSRQEILDYITDYGK